MKRSGWLGLALVWAACAKQDPAHPQLVNDGAYELTVPAGWSAVESRHATFQSVTLTPKGDDGLCTFTFTPGSGPLQPEQFARNLVQGSMKGAGATTSVPMVLQTGFGPFSGAHFEGKAPASGLGGALAAFAGPVTTETFGGVEGETYVGVSISTFAVSDHQLQVRASCEGVARSLRLASK